jgi:hypothetical protein
MTIQGRPPFGSSDALHKRAAEVEPNLRVHSFRRTIRYETISGHYGAPFDFV